MMAAPRLVLVNLPSPPGINIMRDVAGGFGRFHSKSDRAEHGHDKGVHFNPPAIEAHGASLAEYLGAQTSIVDGQGEDLNAAELIKRVSRLDPDIILMRPCLPSYSWDLEIASILKKRSPDVPIIAWGAISSSMSDRLMSESNFDSISLIDLPSTVLTLLSEGMRGIEVPRIIHRSGCKNSGSYARCSIDLDSLPFPAYHLLNMELYKIGSQRRFTVYGSVGCSFFCYYCPYPIGFGSPWIGRNPKRVFEEIRWLGEEYGVRQIGFRDQTWNMDLKRSMKMCEMIQKWRDGLEWTAAVRADKLGYDLARSMKSAGCRRVDMGLETGDPDIFNSVGKRSSKLKFIERGFRNAKRAGLVTTANVMIGLPGDGWRSIEYTKKVLKELNPENVLVSVATPYPGTRFYREAVENDWLENVQPEDLDGFTPVLSYPGFSRAEIYRASRALGAWRRSERRIRKIKGFFRDVVAH